MPQAFSLFKLDYSSIRRSICCFKNLTYTVRFGTLPRNVPRTFWVLFHTTYGVRFGREGVETHNPETTQSKTGQLLRCTSGIFPREKSSFNLRTPRLPAGQNPSPASQLRKPISAQLFAGSRRPSPLLHDRLQLLERLLKRRHGVSFFRIQNTGFPAAKRVDPQCSLPAGAQFAFNVLPEPLQRTGC